MVLLRPGRPGWAAWALPRQYMDFPGISHFLHVSCFNLALFHLGLGERYHPHNHMSLSVPVYVQVLAGRSHGIEPAP